MNTHNIMLLMSTHNICFYGELGKNTLQPVDNTIVGVHSLNHVSQTTVL